MPAPLRITVALPPDPVDWQGRALTSVRASGARTCVFLAPHDISDTRPLGPLARILFRLERHWSSPKPTGLETVPAESLPPTDNLDGEEDIRLNLAGDHAFSGPPPVGGEWCIRFDDTADPLAAARHAVLTGATTTTVTLHRRYPDGTSDTLTAIAGVNPFSATDTVRTTTALASALPARALAQPNRESPPHACTPHAALASPPSPLGLLYRLLREAYRDATSRKQWYLLLGSPPSAELLPSPSTLTPVFPPADRIWADPFVVEDAEATWVFFESMTFADKRGEIAVGRWDGTRLTDVRPALATAHHLSYPQIFAHAGKRWLTVESAQAGEVRAYACERWPDRWSRGPLVHPVAMIDPSVFEHAGRWWLIGNLPPGPGAKADGELYVFFNDNPFAADAWTPHPLNPVVSDARHGRGAGRPFVRAGRLFRPAQDCAGGYGRQVVLREITELTPETFAETTVATRDASGLPGAMALHTFNPAQTVVAMDAARRI